MAGHSKWANIKHRKGAQDLKKGAIFQRLSKEIIVALKTGDKDPDNNPRLRFAIEKAKSQNMPLDNIKRLIDRQNKDDKIFYELVYEGYGVNGVAVLVECLTDNINRTAANVKAIFNKNNGSMGTKGSVSYLFQTKGIIVLEDNNYDEENIMQLLLEEGLENIEKEDNLIILELNQNNLLSAKNILIENKMDTFVTTEISKIPTQKVKLSENEFVKLERLLNMFEDNDDVQNVYNNAEE